MRPRRQLASGNDASCSQSCRCNEHVKREPRRTLPPLKSMVLDSSWRPNTLVTSAVALGEGSDLLAHSRRVAGNDNAQRRRSARFSGSRRIARARGRLSLDPTSRISSSDSNASSPSRLSPSIAMTRPPGRTSEAPRSSQTPGANVACESATSNGRKSSRAASSSSRARTTSTLESSRARRHSRKKATFLAMGSTNVSFSSGRARATGIAGKPFPEPTSTTRPTSGSTDKSVRASSK